MLLSNRPKAKCIGMPVLSHNRSFVADTHHAVAIPMIHLFIRFNMQGSLAQRPSVEDLSSPVPPTCIALPLFLLTAQVLPKRPALRLVGINILINGFMADGQHARNLELAI